ncbi:thiamine/thiamine pyrophosphate ABC transporter permease ThiP, partial [Alphaproteobacteria bacterium]|nr:thiamine/thiamine pyrophosphate ABC transporter permease ThiP [Alphaproteobacteria bacterium]
MGIFSKVNYNIEEILIFLKNSYTQRIIFFSFYQAFLSALISCILAIPFALALNRHKDHKLIRYIISLCGFSFVIPSILIVFSVIKIFGYNGILNKYFNFYDFMSIESIYGLKAILIAHILLNAPFATRLFVQNLNNIPKNYYEISESINLSFFGNIFKLEIPIIRQSLFAVFSIIFSLCFLSFAIVMA